MTDRKAVWLLGCGIALLSAAPTQAQKAHVPNEGVLRYFINFEQHLPPAQRNLLSSAVASRIAFAHSVLDKPTVGPDDDGGPPPLKLGAATTAPGNSRINALGGLAAGFQSGTAGENENRGDVESISSTKQEFQITHLGGFNQSTSSSAWCGSNVVTGYESSLAAVQTNVLPFIQNPNLQTSASSAVGVAFSRDSGESFSDEVVLNPGPTVSTATVNSGSGLQGNPVVVCRDPHTFYFLTSPFTTEIANPQNFTAQVFAGVGMNVSKDGGKTWADPTPVINKSIQHLLDRAWLAIDDRNPQRLYVSYTDLDLDGIFQQTQATARCPGTIRQAIELVSSADGGATWSTPAIVNEVCFQFVNGTLVSKLPTGSQIAVGHSGRVYVSYVLFAADASDELRFRGSADRGQTFEPEVLVSNVVATGDPVGPSAGALQGFFANIQVPTMAVGLEHSGRETLYIAWSDGRDNPQVDVVTATGFYNFADILFSKSVDGGATWSKPQPVSPTPDDFSGAGRDQFQPAIAVNTDGVLAVCYYDRRNDASNNAVDRFCSVSTNQGRSFRDQRLTNKSWAPIHDVDAFFFGSLGEYDTLAIHKGTSDDDAFFSSFQIIDNSVTAVHGRSFRRDE